MEYIIVIIKRGDLSNTDSFNTNILPIVGDQIDYGGESYLVYKRVIKYTEHCFGHFKGSVWIYVNKL
jgi:hypothetical protein